MQTAVDALVASGTSHLSTLILNLQNNYLAKDRIDAKR